MIKVEKIKNQTEKDLAYAIRQEVFVIEQEVDPAEEYDEEDEISTHFIAYCDGRVCGTARWRFKSAGLIKLERFAVSAAFRNRGVGKALVEAVIHDLPFAKKVILHAQIQAVPFYEKLGFRCYGPEFEEAGIRHFAMEFKG